MQNPPRLRDLIFYFLKLGLTGFGGPIANVGYIHRDLVEKRKWFTQKQYEEGLLLAQMAPGPLSTQLAVYLGWVLDGVRGAAAILIAFSGPLFLILVTAAYFYRRFGVGPWVDIVLRGMAPAVTAVVALTALRLLRKTNGSRIFLWIISVAVATGSIVWGLDSYLLLLLSGLLVFGISWRPKSLMEGGSLLVTSAVIGFSHWKFFGIFFKAGAFVFGSGLVIVPFLQKDLVTELHWLTQKEFLDIVGIGMMSPGPFLMSVSFMGYLIKGFPGAVIASVGAFLPCFLLTILIAPKYKQFLSDPRWKRFIDGVIAGAMGLLLASVERLASESVIGNGPLMLATCVLISQTIFPKVNSAVWIPASGLLSLVLNLLHIPL